MSASKKAPLHSDEVTVYSHFFQKVNRPRARIHACGKCGKQPAARQLKAGMHCQSSRRENLIKKVRMTAIEKYTCKLSYLQRSHFASLFRPRPEENGSRHEIYPEQHRQSYPQTPVFHIGTHSRSADKARPPLTACRDTLQAPSDGRRRAPTPAPLCPS